MSRRSLSSPQLRSDSSASPAPHSTIQRLSVPGSKPIVFVKAFLMHCIVTIFILIVKGRKKYFPRDSYPSHRFLTFLPTLAPSDGSADTLATAKQGQLFCVSHSHIFVFIHIKNMNSFFLNRCFPRMRREVPSLRGDRGKLAYTGQNIYCRFVRNYSYESFLFFSFL